MSTWVTIDVKVAQDTAHPVPDYADPNPYEVAATIRERLEGVDLGTGWVITKVSAGTQGFYPPEVMEP